MNEMRNAKRGVRDGNAKINEWRRCDPPSSNALPSSRSVLWRTSTAPCQHRQTLCFVENILNVEPKLDIVHPHPVPLPQERVTRRPIPVSLMPRFQVFVKVSTEQNRLLTTKTCATHVGINGLKAICQA